MDTKAEKLRLILQGPSLLVLEAPRNSSQEVYRRKLAEDIARTKKYIHQANTAIDKLEQEHGNWPFAYDESVESAADRTGSVGRSLSPELLKKVHLLAHYEVYKQMPYKPMKNDLIGIATALTLTLEAVSQQALAIELFTQQNEIKREEIRQLKLVLDDYIEANRLVRRRIEEQSSRIAEMQLKIDQCSTYDDEVSLRLTQTQELLNQAKTREDHLHQHLQKVVLKLYAMMDWENAHLMDENTFKENIALSVTLIKNLVANLGDDPNPKWVAIVPGTSEERLVEVMVRNNMLISRENEGLEVRLRNYGLP